jgi:plasmid stability protein
MVPMGQILVRNLEDAVIEKLKARAAREKRSLEQTVREILMDAAKPSRSEVLAEMDRIRAMTPKRLDSSVPLIRAFRDGDDPES